MDFFRASDRRVELPFGGELCEIAAEMVEGRRLRFLLTLRRRLLRRRATLLRRGTSLGHFGPENAERFGARGVEVHTGIRQHLRRDSLLFA